MTPEQKRDFYRDGYYIFRDIVPKPKVLKAAQTIFSDLSRIWSQSMNLGRRMQFEKESLPEELRVEWLKSVKSGLRTGVNPAILDLISSTDDLIPTIVEALGEPIRKPPGAQLATIFPSEINNGITECGYRNLDIPFYGWHGHLDGLWNGSAPPHQRTDRPMNEEELANWSKEGGRNGVQRTYPKTNCNINNFTALLGIPLSDQMNEGCGNLGLLRGAHHHIEKFFQNQRAQGGPLGPDGPNWPRVDEEAPNRSGLRHYPDEVREKFKDSAAYTEDGHIWPKPDLIKVKPGDAVLVLHAVPHCSTRNESVTPRIMAYFRLVPESRWTDKGAVFPDALCDCWLEWQGMQETVAEMRSSSST